MSTPVYTKVILWSFGIVFVLMTIQSALGAYSDYNANIQLYFPFDQNSSDYLTPSITGIDTSISYTTPAYLGNAAYFNAVGDRILWVDNRKFDYNANTNYTIEFGLNLTSIASYEYIYEDRGLTGTSVGIIIWHNGADPGLYYHTGSCEFNTVCTDFNAVAGEKNYVGFVWLRNTTSDKILCYKNGVNIQNLTSSCGSSAVNFNSIYNQTFGNCSGTPASEDFDGGMIDEFIVHNVSLSAADMAEHYNGSLLLSYPFGAVGDTTPPSISAVTNGTVTNISAYITWTTDESSNSTVNYGTTTALGTFVYNATMTTSHTVYLSGLTNSTLYYYNVTSCDAAGNCAAYSGTYNFTTAANPPPASLPSGGANFSLAWPTQYAFFARTNATHGHIIINGTWTGNTSGGIEASFNGGTYVTIDAGGATDGSFNALLKDQLIGNGSLTVRSVLNTSSTITVNNVAIGHLFVVAGQSNALGSGQFNQNLSASNPRAAYMWKNGAWGVVTDPTGNATDAGPSAWPLLANNLTQTLGQPVGIINLAVSGTSTTQWQSTSSAYKNMIQGVTAATRGSRNVTGVLIDIGETDAITTGTISGDYTAFKGNLTAFINNTYADLNVKYFVLSLTGEMADPANPTTRSELDAIRKAQADIAFESDRVYQGPVTVAINKDDVNNLHYYSNTNLANYSDLWARSIINATTAYDGVGPRFVSATSNGTRITVTFDENVTFGSGNHGFYIWNSTATITDAGLTAVASGQTVVITLTSAVIRTGARLSMGSFNDALGLNYTTDVGGNPAIPIFNETITMDGSGLWSTYGYVFYNGSFYNTTLMYSQEPTETSYPLIVEGATARMSGTDYYGAFNVTNSTAQSQPNITFPKYGSIETWFYPNFTLADGLEHFVFLWAETATGNNGPGIEKYTNDNWYIGFTGTNGTDMRCVNTTAELGMTNTWHQVVIVYNVSNATTDYNAVYVDGVLKCNKTGLSMVNTASANIDLSLGVPRVPGAGTTSNTFISVFGVINYTLTSSDVSDLYTQGIEYDPFTPVEPAWWTWNYVSTVPTNIFDGDPFSFSLNISYNVTASLTATFVFNGVSQNVTNTSGSNYTYYTSALTGYDNATYPYYWFVTATIANGSSTTLNVSGSLEVGGFSLDNCSSYNTTIINWNSFNEDYPSTVLNQTFQLGVIYWTNDRDNFQTYNVTYETDSTFSLCVNNDSVTLYMDIYGQATEANTGYVHRFYVQNGSFTGSSVTNYSIFNFNSTTGLSILRITSRKNEDYTYFLNVLAYLQRRYVGEGVWRTVQMDKSGDFGLLYFNIKEATTDYRLIYYDENNNVLLETIPLKFSCTSGVCDITQLLDEYTEGDTNENLSANYTYNNATKVLTVSWRGSPSGSSTVDLSVIKQSMSGQTVICNETQNGNAGSLECNLTSYGDGEVQIRVTSDEIASPLISEWYKVGSFGISKVLSVGDQSIWGFGIASTIVFAGMFSPAGVIIMSVLALVILMVFGIVAPITLTFITIGVCVALYLSFKVRS